MALEARLSDGDVVGLFSCALENIVNPEGGLICKDDAHELYRFMTNYFKEHGTGVTATNLKKKFDEKLVTLFTDYLYSRYYSSTATRHSACSYWYVPATALVVSGGARFLGLEKVGSIGLDLAFFTGLVWLGYIAYSEYVVRSARRKAVADASHYIQSLSVERFEHLLLRAAEPYRERFKVETRV